MQGRILIVDPIATNRIVLKVKLTTAFYEVLQAGSMADAARIAKEHLPALIICALNLPDGSAARLCEALSTEPQTRHIAMLALGGRPDPATRLATLAAGVQDVMTRPLDDTLLLGRVRSLIRARNVATEWQLRDDPARALGMAEDDTPFAPQGHCVLVGADKARIQAWARALRPNIGARLTLACVNDVLRQVHNSGAPDTFVIALPEDPRAAQDALRLISVLRANGETRHAGILVLQTAGDAALGADALDLGADDLMTNGFEAGELTLRLKALMRHKRMAERLRATVRTGLRAAVLDPLTGLHNRRYAMPHLARLAENAVTMKRPFAVMLCDLDHFKRINDLHGHAAGDAVLVEVAERLRRSMRPIDMVARIGGEEFMIVMPAASQTEAQTAALRICNAISCSPIDLPACGHSVIVTISIGMVLSGHCDAARPCMRDPAAVLMARADKALYAAKVNGRNTVELGRPAA